MEKTKLTLRLDAPVIASAKQYAKAHNITLSGLVARFFYTLPDVEGETPPVLRELRGILPANAFLGEHRDYLAKKYG